MAIISRGRDRFARLLKLFAILYDQPVDAFVAPFVMGAGMYHDGLVCSAVKLNGAVMGAIMGRWSFGAIGLFGQDRYRATHR